MEGVTMKLLVLALTAVVHMAAGHNINTNQIFGYLDTNADGVLTRAELDVGCHTGRIPVDTWRSMFDMGSLSLSQFSDEVNAKAEVIVDYDNPERNNYGDFNNNEIVQTLDTNIDGYIDQNEIGPLFGGFEGRVDDTMWGMVTGRGDKNGDGKISWMEFKCMDDVVAASDIDDNCLCFL